MAATSLLAPSGLAWMPSAIPVLSEISLAAVAASAIVASPWVSLGYPATVSETYGDESKKKSYETFEFKLARIAVQYTLKCINMDCTLVTKNILELFFSTYCPDLWVFRSSTSCGVYCFASSCGLSL